MNTGRVTLEADWYVDPLGRFEGRFFNGEHWTARVISAGQEMNDPSFIGSGAPAESLAESGGADASVFELATEPAVEPISTGHRRASDSEANAEQSKPREASPREARHSKGGPTGNGPPRDAEGRLIESPVLVVAVLDASTVRSHVPQRRSRIPWLIAGLIGIAALVAVFLVVGRDPDDGVASNLDDTQLERVRDIEASGTNDGSTGEQDAVDLSVEEFLDDDARNLAEVDPLGDAADPTTTFDAADALTVGPVQFVNGAPMLRELAIWHQDFADTNQTELPEGNGCWFGELGGGVLQLAFCGPVGVTSDGDYLFDLVPLFIEDVADGQLARPLIDSVERDEPASNGLELIGPPEQPYTFAEGG